MSAKVVNNDDDDHYFKKRKMKMNVKKGWWWCRRSIEVSVRSDLAIVCFQQEDERAA